MAESGWPVSEPSAPEGAISSEVPTKNDSNLPLLETSTELVKDQVQPGELHNTSSDVSCSERVLENDSQLKAKPRVPVTHRGSDRLSIRNASSRPRSIAEVHISEGVELQLGKIMNHRNEQVPLLAFKENASASHTDLREQSLAPDKLSVQRSNSDSLQTQKECPAPLLHCETGGSNCLGRNQKAPLQSFICKQAMQLQQSNTTTTFCRAGSTGSGSPTQQSCCIHICNSGTAQFTGDLGMDTAVCCGSYNHGTLEDTFAAYCHPQPIPAPAQLLPRQIGMKGDCRGQMGGPALLALPPLISSVSETGLDAKRLLRCCNLDCNWPSPLCQAGSQHQLKEEGRSTREAGTMTSSKELRDVGVQVRLQMDSDRPPQHVFPEVCLMDERTNGTDKPSASQKSPVKEVKWDAEGMTWEVYGASVDPEELGLAIQKHLELQIKETAVKAAKLARQDTNMSQNSTGKSQRRRRSLMAALRPPGCCSRTTTAVD
uniref:Si:dkey-191g9.7 n=1 Tax=Astyanax mexicanus TaxID=7994 RepID=W5LSR4_ASTMX